jgi:hypothetical protein
MSDELPEGTHDDEQRNEEVPSSALVEFEDGLAIFFGDETPDGLEVVPFSFIDEGTLRAVSAAVGTAVGLGSVGAQGANAALQAQGLVRLAPQTINALKTATPMVKDGWNLGTLVGGGGGGGAQAFSASVRWLPATAATTASVVAAMGPAITLMVIQYQLNQIAAVAQHNLDLTSKVLQVVRQSQWSAVTGHYETLIRELRHARRIGEVTDAVFGEVRGYQGELTSQWDANRHAVQRHVIELEKKVGHKERQQYLTDNGQAIIADVQALLLSQTSWFVYQSLRAGHLLRSAKASPADGRLLDGLITEARDLHERSLAETDELLDQLAREFAVLAELPGKRTFKIGGTARAAKESHLLVRQLQEALGRIRGQESSTEITPLALPTVLVFEDDVPDELVRILPFRLQKGEKVLALADVSFDRITLPRLSDGWVAVTDRRLLLTKQDSLRRVGAVDSEVSLANIRYVRRSSAPERPPVVEVITRDGDVTLRFPAWAKAGTLRRTAVEFGELVASFMNLPAEEVPEVHLATVSAQTGESRAGGAIGSV